jgi:Uma2 family endonuclease
MSHVITPNVGTGGGVDSLPVRIQLSPAVALTPDQFFELCQQNREMRFERTAQGELIVMPPSAGETGAQNFSILGQLYIWVEQKKKGKGFDSSAGFTLPNGATRSPDVSWVSDERLTNVTPEQMKKFPPVCPDFLVEVMSPTDSLQATKDKMVEYMANGARLGWLIHPDKKQVYVYRPQQPVQSLDNPKTVSGDPELPGFVLDLQRVWGG